MISDNKPMSAPQNGPVFIACKASFLTQRVDALSGGIDGPSVWKAETGGIPFGRTWTSHWQSRAKASIFLRALERSRRVSDFKSIPSSNFFERIIKNF